MKINRCLFKIYLVIIIIAILSSNAVYASDIFERGRNFLNRGEGSTANFGEATIGFQEIAGFLQGIGILVIVVVGAIIGIKYMMGSVEEKAEHKKLLVPYLVGSVVIFGALTIWRMSINILSTV